jgi:hypothetical protein
MPLKKPKSIKNSTDRKQKSKSTDSQSFDLKEYRSIMHLKKLPLNNVYIAKLAEELVQWVLTDPDALRVSQFYLKKGFSKDAYYELLEKHADLKAANDIAIDKIGENRELGWLKNTLNGSAVHLTLPYYCGIAKVAEEMRAQLKKDEDRQSTTINVELSQIPSSGKVPPKNKITIKSQAHQESEDGDENGYETPNEA